MLCSCYSLVVLCPVTSGDKELLNVTLSSYAFAAAVDRDEHDPGAFDGVLDRFQGGGAWGSGVGLEVLDGGQTDARSLGKLALRDVE